VEVEQIFMRRDIVAGLSGKREQDEFEKGWAIGLTLKTLRVRCCSNASLSEGHAPPLLENSARSLSVGLDHIRQMQCARKSKLTLAGRAVRHMPCRLCRRSAIEPLQNLVLRRAFGTNFGRIGQCWNIGTTKTWWRCTPVYLGLAWLGLACVVFVDWAMTRWCI
jgi:hypothetical protein